MQAALDYGRRGFSIFPCSQDKAPLTEHGFKDASPDLRKIRQWWTQFPDASIGISCIASGLIVLDTDPRNGGLHTLQALEQEHEPLPITLTALTGMQNDCRGTHRYYRAPEGDIKVKGQLGEGIDCKYSGYVIAAPSQHQTGVNYQWIDEYQPIADLPKWISDIIIKKPAKAPRRRTSAGHGDSITDQYNLRVQDYLMPENGRYISSDEIRGAHPAHGSSTGNNLCINIRKNTWYCFRHQTGGGGVEAYAVARGIIDCSEAGAGCLNNKWSEFFRCLREDGIITPTEADPEILASIDALIQKWRRLQACQN
ncbi:bifunctional DNA primase/polymerase [Methanoplanus endosymbiosus]|uniref:Bifunctional DNA primase/polymerase n=1 Tax=Methanoplanus endosymbiosus TaxID=33865 RepID=A0A9E7PLM2_9EURY|nr:bifunctional DNA primase/polymerase [Methanoplanus endosymbiosus]UUX91622.1 bifunctional DNA primase/polymerase [Methanoplanus endosymbiosus]